MSPSRSELADSLSRWERAVRAIEHGWDCIEEYQHDVSERESLQECVIEWSQRWPLDDALRARMMCADAAFRASTEASRLCVWHVGPQFRIIGNDTELCYREYEPLRFWYFYRWQPDSPIDFREHFGLSYQWTCYGMDFSTMSQAELVAAARAFMTQARRNAADDFSA